MLALKRFISLCTDQKTKNFIIASPTKNPSDKKRYSREKSPCRYGKIRLITERPAEIALRKRFGHWEEIVLCLKVIKKKQ